MLKLFNRLTTLRTKLRIQYGMTLMLSVIAMVVALLAIYQISENQKHALDTRDLSQLVLQMRRNEKDFLLRDIINDKYFQSGESHYISTFNQAGVSAERIVDQLKRTGNGEIDSLENLTASLRSYTAAFHHLVDLHKKKGFKDFGIEGEMRKAVHRIESGNTSYDTVSLLALRRYEKDFLARKDASDLLKFDQRLTKFTNRLRDPGRGDAQAQINLLASYGKRLHEIADIQSQIGFTESEGMTATLHSSANRLEAAINRLSQAEALRAEQFTTQVIFFLIIAFGAMLVLGIWMAYLFVSSLNHSVQQINERIQTLANGQIPNKIETRLKDEMGRSAMALNNLVDRIAEASTFAEKIGKGELNIEYDSDFKNDVLAQALQGMHVKLKDAAEDNRKRGWVTTGLANFGEILRATDSDVRTLSQNIISHLVKYLKANQGQLFVVAEAGDGSEQLELMATYAWEKTKFISKTISPGEGLTGQAWLEKNSIYLKEIPKNYIRITSGLGEALPNCVLIVPMKVNEEVFGVLELGSFNLIEDFEIEFVEKLAELLASALASVKVNERTKQLLAESQHQTEELRAQEEEMRQNMEELTATKKR